MYTKYGQFSKFHYGTVHYGKYMTKQKTLNSMKYQIITFGNEKSDEWCLENIPLVDIEKQYQ